MKKPSLPIRFKQPAPIPAGGPLKIVRKSPTLGRHGSGEPYRINPSKK